MTNTLAPWIILLATFGAAVWAAIEARRARRAAETLLQPSPLPTPQPIPEPTGGGGPGPVIRN